MNDMINDAVNKGLISFVKPGEWLLKALATPAVHSKLTIGLVNSIPITPARNIDRVLCTRHLLEIGNININ